MQRYGEKLYQHGRGAYYNECEENLENWKVTDFKEVQAKTRICSGLLYN